MGRRDNRLFDHLGVEIAFATDAGNLVRQSQREHDLGGARKAKSRSARIDLVSLTIARLLPRLDNADRKIFRLADYPRFCPRAGRWRVIATQTRAIYLEPLSDSLAELRRARALIGKPLAIDIDDRHGRAFDPFFFDLRSQGLGDQ